MLHVKVDRESRQKKFTSVFCHLVFPLPQVHWTKHKKIPSTPYPPLRQWHCCIIQSNEFINYWKPSGSGSARHSAHGAVLPWESAYRVLSESCPPCLTPFPREVLPSQCSVDLSPIKTAAVIAISIMQNLPPASGLTRSGGALPTACVSYSCIFHTLHNDAFRPSATCGCFLGPTHQYIASLQGHSNKKLESLFLGCRKVKVEVSRSCE